MVRGFPLSRVSSCANSSDRCSIRSASFQISLPLSDTVSFLQGPFLKAFRADFTARSISAFSPLGTRVRTVLLEGSRTSKYLHWQSRLASHQSTVFVGRRENLLSLKAVAVWLRWSWLSPISQSLESKIRKSNPYLINFDGTSIIILIGNEIKVFFKLTGGGL